MRSKFRIGTKEVIIYCLGILASILAAIYIFMVEKEYVYGFYFLLPLSYAVFITFLLFCNHSIFKSPIFYIVTGMYFAKEVITPVLSVMGDWYTLLPHKEYLVYLPESILLCCWEMVFVGAGLVITTRKWKRKSIKVEFLSKEMRNFDGADFTICFCVLLLIAIVLYYPPLQQRFQFLSNIETNRDAVIKVRSWRNFFVENSRYLPLGLVDTFMMYIFYIVRVLFPLMLLEKIYLRFQNREKNAVIYSFLILILGVMITTSSNGDTIITGMCLCFMICRIYPHFSKKYGILVVGLGGIVASILFLLKVRGGTGNTSEVSIAQQLSANMNAYLNGPFNMTAVFAAKNEYHFFMGIEDFLGGLPIFDRFFHGYQTSELFNKLFWGGMGRTDQLLSGIGQGYFYFGTFLSPIIPLFFVTISIKINNYSRRMKGIKEQGYMLFLSILLALMVGINFSHFLSYMRRYLPGLLILFMKKTKVRPKHESFSI